MPGGFGRLVSAVVVVFPLHKRVGTLESLCVGHGTVRGDYAQVPLARHHGVVAGFAQSFGEGQRVISEITLVPGLAAHFGGHGLNHAPHAHFVMVAARHQHSAGCRANG